MNANRPPWDCRLCPEDPPRPAVLYPAHACRQCAADIGLGDGPCGSYRIRIDAWSPYPPPRGGAPVPRESDESLRGRIAEAYGMWGAFLSVVLESSGAVLDECAASVGVERRSGS